MSQQQPQDIEKPPTSSSPNKEWKLEESSLWWLGLDIWKHPGNVLLISSIPFCAGAYFGYKKPSEKLQKLAGADGSKANTQLDKEFGSLNDRRRLGVKAAARALRLATLGTVGTFGVLGAGMWYLRWVPTIRRTWGAYLSAVSLLCSRFLWFWLSIRRWGDWTNKHMG